MTTKANKARMIGADKGTGQLWQRDRSVIDRAPQAPASGNAPASATPPAPAPNARQRPAPTPPSPDNPSSSPPSPPTRAAPSRVSISQSRQNTLCLSPPVPHGPWQEIPATHAIEHRYYPCAILTAISPRRLPKSLPEPRSTEISQVKAVIPPLLSMPQISLFSLLSGAEYMLAQTL